MTAESSEQHARNRANIPFFQPTWVETATAYIEGAVKDKHFSSGGHFGTRCAQQLEDTLGVGRAILTPSCSSALEVAALLSGVGPGDEVIMPSYTFPSTANAFALRGAQLAFVDIDPGNMNMDADLLEDAINDRTRAVVVVHYAGVTADMDRILAIARQHDLFVVEDSAQSLGTVWQGNRQGCLGDVACLSFHATKNIQCGEGGALLLNDPGLADAATVICDKGTDRRAFLRGEVDKYRWQRLGGSHVLPEISAAILLSQLERLPEITTRRRQTWSNYADGLASLAAANRVRLPQVPDGCDHNGHLFYLKTQDLDERNRLQAYLTGQGIGCAPHFVPLHTAPGAIGVGRMVTPDVHTTAESDKLLRLAVFTDISESQVSQVIDAVHSFYG